MTTLICNPHTYYYAMLRKFHDAKLNNDATVTLWGTGSPMREFLFVDDMADAVVFP